MAKPYDASGKLLFDLGPADWLAVAGLAVPAGGAGVTVVDADLSAVSAAPDKLIRVDAGPGSFLVNVDIQAGPDPTLDGRILMYNAVARWRHRLPVRSVVFLLHPRAVTPDLAGRIVDRAADDDLLEFAYRLVRVWELPVEPLLTGPLATLPLASIAAVPAGELPDVVGRIQRRLLTEPADARPADVWTATQWLIGLRYPASLLETVMLDLMNPPEGTALYDLLQKGRVEGRVEGRAEGRAEGRREVLIEAATDLFGPPAASVATRLGAVTDGAEIGRLVARLRTATGWADLLDG